MSKPDVVLPLSIDQEILAALLRIEKLTHDSLTRLKMLTAGKK